MKACQENKIWTDSSTDEYDGCRESSERELVRTATEVLSVSQSPLDAVDDKVHGIVSFATVHDKVHDGVGELLI